jgi:hypothetical protein
MEGWELTARESIRDLVIRYNANGDSGRFAQVLELNESHAKGRCDYSVLTSHGLDRWGRYTDDYACSVGRWLFSDRKVTVGGYVAGGMGAAGVGATAVALSGTG